MKLKLFSLCLWGVLIISGLPLIAGEYYNPLDYQYNMTITGTMVIDNIEISGKDTLFAFAGEKCCGLISPKFESSSGRWFFYLVVYGNGNSEEIAFKYFNNNTSSIFDLKNSMLFEIDKIRGTPSEPYRFSDRVLSLKNISPVQEILINSTHKTISFQLDKTMTFELVDLSGRMIYSSNLEIGRTTISLREIPGSLYIIRLHNGAIVHTRKIIF